MDAHVGDSIVLESERVGQPAHSGVVEEVLKEQPPRYRVRWEDGRESIVAPAAGAARIEPKKSRPRPSRVATEDLTRALDEAEAAYELFPQAHTESALAEAEALAGRPRCLRQPSKRRRKRWSSRRLTASPLPPPRSGRRLRLASIRGAEEEAAMEKERFRDRAEAGRLLADRLRHYAGRDDVIVLALPRGGVPVGYEVAKALGAPLDVFVVRKLGVPGYEELAMGAIVSGGSRR